MRDGALYGHRPATLTPRAKRAAFAYRGGVRQSCRESDGHRQSDPQRQNSSCENCFCHAVPAFVFGLTLVVGIGIAWFVLPNLSQVFSRLNVTLPIFTVILIAIGNFLGAYGLFSSLRYPSACHFGYTLCDRSRFTAIGSIGTFSAAGRSHYCSGC